MIDGLVIIPNSTATSGNTSWMLKTNGARRRRAVIHPARPNVRGGDIASTASGRGRLAAATSPVSAVKPPNASARAGMLRLSVGNGCTRVMRPQSVTCSRTNLAVPAFFDAVMAIPRQRRHDVKLMTSRGELAGDARDHLAGRGDIGREVRAQHEQVHRSPSPARS